MYKKLLSLLFVCATLHASAQDLEISLTGGSMNYVGDLQPKFFNLKQALPAGGLKISYSVSPQFSIRTGFTYGKVQAYDQLSTDATQKARNLNFQSRILEFHLAGEYDILPMDQYIWSPYVFAGVGVFQFNPYTKDAFGNQVFLQSLATEGQGLAGNSDPYKLTALSIPMGVGVKVALSQAVTASGEFGLRKIFTDYLDDVSGNYPSQSALLAAKGPQSVALSFRGDELPPFSASFPSSSTARGTKSGKDWYYYAGLSLSLRLSANSGGQEVFRGSPKF